MQNLSTVGIMLLELSRLKNRILPVRHARRIESIRRSTYRFCQGEWAPLRPPQYGAILSIVENSYRKWYLNLRRGSVEFGSAHTIRSVDVQSRRLGCSIGTIRYFLSLQHGFTRTRLIDKIQQDQARQELGRNSPIRQYVWRIREIRSKSTIQGGQIVNEAL